MTKQEEIEDLKAKIKARDKQPGYGRNVIAMKARLAELEASE